MKESDRKPLVIAAVDDLFFSAKIEAAAKAAGVELIQANNSRVLDEQLQGVTPNLIILDLNSKACLPFESIRRIKADQRLRGIPVVGFFSHVQVELERAAQEAGCDHILPRSVFSARLSKILQTGKP